MYYLATLLGQVYHTVIPFVILLGILIFVHELGHFLVARWCGVRVEVFSLGFGKKILKYQKGDTLYCISIIPLGGYVKMYGEQSDAEIPEDQKSVSFTHKNVWQRIAIVLAGPFMNFFFAIFVFAFIAQIGEEARAPIVAEVAANTSAALSGFQAGDQIVDVNGEKIKSYEEFQKALNKNQDRVVEITLIDTSGAQKVINLKVNSIPNPNLFTLDKTIGSIEGILPLARGTTVAVHAGSIAAKLGFRTGDQIIEVNSQKVTRWADLTKLLAGKQNLTVKVDRPNLENLDEKNKQTETFQIDAATIEKNPTMDALGFENSDQYLIQIVKDSPAAKAGLKPLDKIEKIDGQQITKWEQVQDSIKAYNGQQALDITLLRDGTEIHKKITPEVTSQMTMQGQEDKRYTIGIMPFINYAEPALTIVKADSIFQSIAKGFDRTWDITTMTVVSFVRLFQGQVSHKNIGGMLSIGKAAKDSFEHGLQSFLMTMGILSVSLFILNLLPIPVLDGGHLVFYTIEVIKGSPLSLKKMQMAQQVGFILLMGLMMLAMFNDVTKFIFKP